MYGTREPAGPPAGFGNTNTGGLYGAGRYSYSSNLTGAFADATLVLQLLGLT